MASLGEFGTPRPVQSRAEGVEPETFLYFGETIAVKDEVDDLDLIDYLDAARRIDSVGIIAVAYVKDGLRLVIDPDDFDLFWETARANRQNIEDLTELMTALIEGSTGRPTQQLSDSSAGQLPTPESSEAESSSPPASSGRPDLQVIHEDSAAGRARVLALAANG